MDHSDDTRDIFIVGLRNAHAMENQALSVMRPQVERLEHYPDLKAMLQRHISETEGQIVRLEQIFDMVDESPSGLKATLLSAMGAMASMSHSLASDEVLKNSMANYMFEHFEIAAYTSLITMAGHVGAASAVPLLEQSLAEERRFADWLHDALPTVTDTFMTRTAAGLQAGV